MDPQEEPLDLSKTSDLQSYQEFPINLVKRSSVNSANTSICDELDGGGRESVIRCGKSTDRFFMQSASADSRSIGCSTGGDTSSPIGKMEEPHSQCDTTRDIASFELDGSPQVERFVEFPELPLSTVVLCNPSETMPGETSRISESDHTTIAAYPCTDHLSIHMIIPFEDISEDELDVADADTTAPSVNSPTECNDEFITTYEGPHILSNKDKTKNQSEDESDPEFIDLTDVAEEVDNTTAPPINSLSEGKDEFITTYEGPQISSNKDKTQYQSEDESDPEFIDLTDVAEEVENTTAPPINSLSEGKDEFITTYEGPQIPLHKGRLNIAPEEESDPELIDLTSDVEVFDVSDDERVQPNLSKQKHDNRTLCSKKRKSCNSGEVSVSEKEMQIETTLGETKNNKRPRSNIRKSEDKEAIERPGLKGLGSTIQNTEELGISSNLCYVAETAREQLRNCSKTCLRNIDEPVSLQNSNDYLVSNRRIYSSLAPPRRLEHNNLQSRGVNQLGTTFTNSALQPGTSHSRMYSGFTLEKKLAVESLLSRPIPQYSSPSYEQDLATMINKFKTRVASSTAVQTEVPTVKCSLPKKLRCPAATLKTKVDSGKTSRKVLSKGESGHNDASSRPDKKPRTTIKDSHQHQTEASDDGFIHSGTALEEIRDTKDLPSLSTAKNSEEKLVLRNLDRTKADVLLVSKSKSTQKEIRSTKRTLPLKGRRTLTAFVQKVINQTKLMKQQRGQKCKSVNNNASSGTDQELGVTFQPGSSYKINHFDTGRIESKATLEEKLEDRTPKKPYPKSKSNQTKRRNTFDKSFDPCENPEVSSETQSSTPMDSGCVSPKKRLRRSIGTDGESLLRNFVKGTPIFPWVKQFTTVFNPHKTNFVYVDNDAWTIEEVAQRARKRNNPTTGTTGQNSLHIIFRRCRFKQAGPTARQTVLYLIEHGHEIVSLAFQQCYFSTCISIQMILDWCPNLKALSICNCPTLFQNLKGDMNGRETFLSSLKKLRRLEIFDNQGSLDNKSEIGERILKACDSLQSIMLHGDPNSLPILVTALLDKPEKIRNLTEVYLDFSCVNFRHFPCYIIPDLHRLDLHFSSVILNSISFNCNRRTEEEEDLAELVKNQLDLHSVEFQTNFPFQRNSNFIQRFPREVKNLKFTSIEVCDELGLEQLILQSRHLESLTFVNTELPKMGTTFLKEFLHISNQRLKNLSLTLVGVPELERLNTSWDFLVGLPKGTPELTQLDLSRFSHGGLRPDNLNCLTPIFQLKKLKVLMLTSVDIRDEHLIGALLNVPDLASTINLSLVENTRARKRKAIRRRGSILSLSKLQILGLAHNSIGNRTLALMARFMGMLKKLDVSHTLIDLEGLKFAVQVKEFTVLRTVGCKLPETFGEDLTEKLSKIEEFVYLDSEISRSVKPLNFQTSAFI